MDAFLATLSLIFSHNATALLVQIMNRLVQKYIHSGFTFVIKRPLKQTAAAPFTFFEQSLYYRNVAYLANVAFKC